jgi:hypothetical protein
MARSHRASPGKQRAVAGFIFSESAVSRRRKGSAEASPSRKFMAGKMPTPRLGLLLFRFEADFFGLLRSQDGLEVFLKGGLGRF